MWQFPCAVEIKLLFIKFCTARLTDVILFQLLTGSKTSCNYLLFQIFGWVVWSYVSCWRVVYWTEDRRCLTKMDKYALFFHSVPNLLNAAIQFQHKNKHFYVWYGILRNIVMSIIHEDRRHSNLLWMAWSSIFCTTYWEIYLTEPQTNSSETLEIKIRSG